MLRATRRGKISRDNRRDRKPRHRARHGARPPDRTSAPSWGLMARTLTATICGTPWGRTACPRHAARPLITRPPGCAFGAAPGAEGAPGSAVHPDFRDGVFPTLFYIREMSRKQGARGSATRPRHAVQFRCQTTSLGHEARGGLRRRSIGNQHNKCRPTPSACRELPGAVLLLMPRLTWAGFVMLGISIGFKFVHSSPMPSTNKTLFGGPQRRHRHETVLTVIGGRLFS